MTSSVAEKRSKKLGNISSLLNKVAADAPDSAEVGAGEGTQIDINKLSPGKYQPRRDFDEQALNELAASVKKYGVMQPIIIRPIEDGNFEIIAGERRWRAAKIAGLDTIPAVTKEIDDQTALAMALMENIQRENLNPLEEAEALQRLKDEFKLKNKEVAEVVGKTEKNVSEFLVLLKLPEPLKALMDRGTTSAQILGVLNRCYKLDSEATESFVDGKDAVTYADATAFQKSLKSPEEKKDSESLGGEEGTESSTALPHSEEEQDDMNLSDGEGTGLTDSLESPSDLLPESAEPESSEAASHREEEQDELAFSDSQSSDPGFTVDNKNFVVAVEFEEEEWFLNVTRKDDDPDFCWIGRDGETVRVRTVALSLLYVQ